MQARRNITPLHRDLPRSAPSEAHVRQHFASLLASPQFDASSRSRDFLHYVVDEALAGRGATLNQAAIAISVFGRDAQFDPVLDPIVRVQAGRLRRSLERYYLLVDEQPTLRIELPKGSYAPIFVTCDVPPAQAAIVSPTRATVSPPSLPALLVHPFDICSGLDAELASLLNEELTIELQRYGTTHVTCQRDMERLDLKPLDNLQFELCGRVRRQGEHLLIRVRIIDRHSAEQLWSDEFDAGSVPETWSTGAADAARVIAARVGDERGVIVRVAAGTSGGPRLARDDARAMALRCQRFFLWGRPDGLAAAIASAEQLTAGAPDDALAWLYLARLYLTNHAFELCAPSIPIEATIAAAERAVLLDPTSVRMRCTLANALLVRGDLETAHNEIEQARRASGESLAYRETFGWLTALAGDWTRGIALIRDATARNPLCPSYARQALWADCLRRGELEASYEAALEYQDIASFWRELMSACSLGHLGRLDEARACAAALLRIKPDFPLRANALISRYMKSPDLHQLIVRGLCKAGVLLAA